ncbi:MAG: hypothetical protein HFG27_03340 [Provencibacterium sp.]|jgi:hypothetical protein|nr:hypothetical protein [Provencibacterium sp.]
MFLYLPVKEELHSPELGCYRSFGIAAFWVSDGRMKRMEFVSDVSTLETVVSLLACRCTKNQLYPLHLLNVIEDVL